MGQPARYYMEWRFEWPASNRQKSLLIRYRSVQGFERSNQIQHNIKLRLKSSHCLPDPDQYIKNCSNEINYLLLFFSRLTSSLGEIIPLDKWEILPEQIEYDEELGRGAFGVVYKATLKRRAGIELFQNGKQMAQDQKKACRVVAVKVLKGNLNINWKTNKEQQQQQLKKKKKKKMKERQFHITPQHYYIWVWRF